MPYFKIPGDPTPSFLSDEDIGNGGLSLLPSGAQPIGDDEAQRMRVPLTARVIDTPQLSAEQKLAAFLSANPDVLALIKMDG